jgi:hypothetical protein
MPQRSQEWRGFAGPIRENFGKVAREFDLIFDLAYLQSRHWRLQAARIVLAALA